MLHEAEQGHEIIAVLTTRVFPEHPFVARHLVVYSPKMVSFALAEKLSGIDQPQIAVISGWQKDGPQAFQVIRNPDSPVS